MIPDLEALKSEWMNRQFKRFPKPRKPKPRNGTDILTMVFEVKEEHSAELEEYITDAFDLWCDSKGLL